MHVKDVGISINIVLNLVMKTIYLNRQVIAATIAAIIVVAMVSVGLAWRVNFSSDW